MIFIAALVCTSLACNDVKDKYIFSPQSEALRIVILGHNRVRQSEMPKKQTKLVLEIQERRIMYGFPSAKSKSNRSNKTRRFKI